MADPGTTEAGSILIVDDDEDVLVAGRLLLKRHFSSVDVCPDPGELPARPWLFMEGLTTPALRAGEYLADPTRTRMGVEFDGALLIRKKGAENWGVRVVRMRALCNQERLQRFSPQGAWVDYVGRDGTAAKVRWICALGQQG